MRTSEDATDGGEPLDTPRRCGFVALIGAPNAGKSTLLNALVGAKISIVTPKVQTTRMRVRGIVVHEASEIILVDTPGIFAAKRRLERAMVAAAWAGMEEAEEVVLLFDASRPRLDDDTIAILEELKRRDLRIVVALTKIDVIKRERLLELAAEFDAHGIAKRIFMVSGLTGDGVGDLLRYLADIVPESEWLYPEDQLSDLPERMLAAEVTREKLFLQLHEELPYNLTVETEAWENFKDGSVRLEQTIYVARDNHKAMVLGKGGQRVREVRLAAQKDLEGLLGCPVHLFLFVKVRKNWIDDPARYRAWGLEFDA